MRDSKIMCPIKEDTACKKNVIVLGSGVMGKRIAILCAFSGHSVFIWDCVIQDNLLNEIEKIAKLELKLAGHASVNLSEIMSKISIINELPDAAGPDFLIEAVIENFEIKVNLLRDAQKLFGKQMIMTSNTSSLSINGIAAKLQHPESFLGMHFFNSPINNLLIEIIKNDFTSKYVFDECYKFVDSLDHIPIEVPDTPGFIVNKLVFSLIVEAIRLVEDGVPASDMDKAIKLGANHPMGPLELADFIGLDVCHDILNSLYVRTRNEHYKPPKLLSDLIKKGFLGRKVKKGFKNL
jgi:3-hydroxybutyryl-CoA dehydrogenase